MKFIRLVKNPTYAAYASLTVFTNRNNRNHENYYLSNNTNVLQSYISLMNNVTGKYDDKKNHNISAQLIYTSIFKDDSPRI